MHVAWLGKKSPFCGNVTYGQEITQALIERGHQVTFVHFDRGQSSQNVPSTLGKVRGFSWHHCHEVTLPFLFKSQILTIPSFKSGKRLVDALAQLKPDIVHASLTLSPLDFRLPSLCAQLKLPLVVTFHPAFDRKLRTLSSGTQHVTYQMYAPMLAQCDRVIVFSKLQRDLLIRLGVPPKTLAVIPNGVDVNKYSPGPSAIKSTLQARQLFVYQGRLSPEKNVEALLKAWRHAKMGSDCKLAIVGNGPLESALRLFYGGDSSIHWLGFVKDEARRIDILRGADAFLLPSLVEGLSLSLLEAMSCGTACIATDAGADGEVLEDGAGIVIDTQRVSHQLQTILPILRDHPEMARVLGQKARQRALERYTLTTNVSQVENIYAELTPPSFSTKSSYIML
ncbi:glycosyltransferase family 4 protein [Oscillatoria sp. CS-180]|uniref:glycosyltransferase family 4 protein n=1 Tax=Oscillatoria sp. CS-180 TaxID=3021720 RepID=UPI00232FABA0|nr:glycosyltransferase family 4 protein [Oscillatoria sp. CS-180]MDB9526117.1 glycosyltransferase family 4 protein [Oscillatoria sp. CS-180]